MRNAVTYLQIALGCLLVSLGANLFMIPNQMPSGGLGGFLMILHFLHNIPIGTTYFLLNLPILALLLRQYGWKSLMKTIWGIATFSLLLDLTAPLAQYAPTSNLFLATVYGGGLTGIGLGLVMRAGGSTGGTSSLAKVIKHHTGMKVSTFLLLTDLAVLTFGAVTLSVEPVLFSLIMTLLVSWLVQVVNEGFRTARCVMVITETPEAVSAAMMNEIQRGVTRLDGLGEYTGRPRPVLMCIVSEREVQRIKQLIVEADPEAFVFITDAREVVGRGFTLDTEIRRIPFWVLQDGA